MKKLKILAVVIFVVTVALGSEPTSWGIDVGAQCGPTLWSTANKTWFGFYELTGDVGVYWHNPIKEKGWWGEVGVLFHGGSYKCTVGDSSLSFIPLGGLGSMRLGKGIVFLEGGVGGGKLINLRLVGEDLIDLPPDTGSLFTYAGVGVRLKLRYPVEIGVRVPIYSSLTPWSLSLRIGLDFDFKLAPELKLDPLVVTQIGETKPDSLYPGGKFSIKATIKNDSNLRANNVKGKIRLPEGVEFFNVADSFDLGNIRPKKDTFLTFPVVVHPSLICDSLDNMEFIFACNGKKPLFTKFAQDLSDTLLLHRFGIDTLKKEGVKSRQNAMAFLFGVQDFQTERLRDIKYTLRDVYAVKKYLIDVSGFDPNMVFVIQNPTLNDLYDYFGTSKERKSNIYDSVKTYSSKLPQDSIELFVYFSGHGAVKTDTTTVEGIRIDSVKTYLLSVDSIPDPDKWFNRAYPSEILFANLIAIKNSLRVKGITLVIDACHADPVGKEVIPNHLKWFLLKNEEPSSRGSGLSGGRKPTFEETLKTGIVVMLASSREQTAYEDDEEKHGYFTKWLITELGRSNANTSLFDLKDSIYVGSSREGRTNQETKFYICAPTDVIGDTDAEIEKLKKVTSYVR